MPPPFSKSTLQPVLRAGLQQLEAGRLDAFMDLLESEVLNQKIKFPLLEWLAVEWMKAMPAERQIEILERIVHFNRIGSYVIAGVILRDRLPVDFGQSLQKARDFTLFGDAWYVCDILAERVPGYALLTRPEQTIPELRVMARDDNPWIIRSVGVATHLAVKWGLEKKFVDQMFQLLLSLADVTEFHTTTGAGWGAKTIARFHPDLVRTYLPEINNNAQIRPWFKRKLEMGLNLAAKDAQREPRKKRTE